MLLNCTCDSWGPHFHHYSCTDPCVHCSQVGWCTSGTLHMTRQRRGWLDTDMHWCCTSRCMTLWQHATHNCIIMLATHILVESKETSALCVSISLDVAKHPHTEAGSLSVPCGYVPQQQQQMQGNAVGEPSLQSAYKLGGHSQGWCTCFIISPVTHKHTFAKAKCLKCENSQKTVWSLK